MCDVTTVGDNLCMIDLTYNGDNADGGDGNDDHEEEGGRRQVRWEGNPRTPHLGCGEEHIANINTKSSYLAQA